MQLSVKIMALRVMYLWCKDVPVCFSQSVVRCGIYLSSEDTNFPCIYQSCLEKQGAAVPRDLVSVSLSV